MGKPKVRRAFSAAGKVVYFAVMTAVVVIDVIVQVKLVLDGNLGGALLYFIFGWFITLSIGHLVGLLLAAPLTLAGGLFDDR